MPVVEPGAAAPALPADSALTRLMVEDEFKAKEEQANQAEADQMEAREAEARQQQQQAQEPVAAAESPAAATAEESPAAPTAPAQTALPTAAAAVVSVANLLSADDADELPPVAAASETSPAPPTETDDDTVAPALFDNPLTAKAPTANDEENQRVGAELRRLKREALRSKAAGEKAALVSLYPGK